MTIFEVHATVSHRYYARKPKREIVRRIHELARQLGEEPPKAAYLEGCDRDSLARVAMSLHDKFPPEKESDDA